MSTPPSRTCPEPGRRKPKDDVEQRGLAAPAGAGEGHDLTGLDHEVGTVQRGDPAAGIGDLEAARCGCSCPGPGRAAADTRAVTVAGRCFEQLEDLLGRLHPVGAGMEVGAEGTQRQVGLGRQDEHEERGAELHVPIEQTEADGHGDQGDRDGGQQLENERREEGQLEGGHRGRSVAIGDVRDGAGLRLRPPEDLQRGQACHDVEEVAGEPLQRPHAGRRAIPRRQARPGP